MNDVVTKCGVRWFVERNYFTIIFSTEAVVVWTILSVIVPKLMSVYESANVSLPVPTIFVFYASNIFHEKGSAALSVVQASIIACAMTWVGRVLDRKYPNKSYDQKVGIECGGVIFVILFLGFVTIALFLPLIGDIRSIRGH